jgi:serine/threonine protein kinase
MVKDMATGMAFLHSKGIIHRDVKSSNMVCLSSLPLLFLSFAKHLQLVSANWKVKVADFGFSRIKADNQTMTQVFIIDIQNTMPKLISKFAKILHSVEMLLGLLLRYLKTLLSRYSAITSLFIIYKLILTIANRNKRTYTHSELSFGK